MIDVARAANVTPQTVSRAIRNAPEVSEETRERVLRIARELNYVKNNTASSLRGGNGKLIGVVYDNLMNVYYSITVDYLQRELRRRGYSLLAISLPAFKFGRETYEFALSHNVDGIISFLEPDGEIASLIKDYGVHVLLFGRRTEESHIDCIYTDDEAGGRYAAEKLIAVGCKRFCYLTESLNIACAFDRYNGFTKALERQGFSAPVVLDADPSTLEARLKELFASSDAPDGVFCFNDMLAFTIQHYLANNKIPPVKVVGYDNIQQEIHIPNRLTTIGTDKMRMAERAAEIIVARVEGGGAGSVSERQGVFLVEGETA